MAFSSAGAKGTPGGVGAAAVVPVVADAGEPAKQEHRADYEKPDGGGEKKNVDRHGVSVRCFDEAMLSGAA